MIPQEILLIPFAEYEYYAYLYADNRLAFIESLSPHSIELQGRDGSCSPIRTERHVYNDEDTGDLEPLPCGIRQRLDVLGDEAMDYKSILEALSDYIRHLLLCRELPLDNTVKWRRGLVSFIDCFYLGELDDPKDIGKHSDSCSKRKSVLQQYIDDNDDSRGGYKPTKNGTFGNVKSISDPLGIWCCNKFHKCCMEKAFQIFCEFILPESQGQLSSTLLFTIIDFQIQIALMTGLALGNEYLKTEIEALEQSHQLMEHGAQKESDEASLISKFYYALASLDDRRTNTSMDERIKKLSEDARVYMTSRYGYILQTVKKGKPYSIMSFYTQFPLIPFEMTMFYLLRSMKIMANLPIFSELKDHLQLSSVFSSIKSDSWSLKDICLLVKKIASETGSDLKLDITRAIPNLEPSPRNIHLQISKSQELSSMEKSDISPGSESEEYDINIHQEQSVNDMASSNQPSMYTQPPDDYMDFLKPSLFASARANTKRSFTSPDNASLGNRAARKRSFNERHENAEKITVFDTQDENLDQEYDEIDKSHGNKVPFTAEEEEYVKQGFKKYGGKWKLILESYPFHKSRTNQSLKDKMRNIMKKEERILTSKR
jgi:hypothetical protein